MEERRITTDRTYVGEPDDTSGSSLFFINVSALSFLSLMSHPCLHPRRISIPTGLVGVDNAPYFPLLILGQVDVPSGPVLLKPMWLGRAGDCDHPLRGNPGESELARCTAFLKRKLLHLVDEAEVVVEILALVLGGCYVSLETGMSVTVDELRPPGDG
jgi:hypothetical protein